ncbi:hypothetical protein yaldo0001_28950 [Yersinia aldovae ATCC 35236]|nr:hypothetical protein yaldo0001_28950 [Yersinia aldovae ATCC 35236]
MRENPTVALFSAKEVINPASYQDALDNSIAAEIISWMVISIVTSISLLEPIFYRCDIIT